jgi:uncharacterized protein (TIGR03067 family)
MNFVRPAVVLMCAGLLAADAPEGKSGAETIKGIWSPVSMIYCGIRVPDDPTSGPLFTAFDGKSFVQRKGIAILQEGTYSIDSGKTPKTIDFQIEKGDDAGKKQLGIYTFDGDNLKICLAKPGASRRPKMFDGAESWLVVSRRYRP